MTLILDALQVRLPGQTGALFPPVSLRIAAGEIACVMGPSGIGKSTLLDAVGGHLDPQATCLGRVLLDGRDVTALAPEKRQIGLVFQDAALFPHLSVGDNIAFGLPQGLRGRARRRAAVEAALEAAGLSGLASRDPATLSGGQRMRAALMRTLVAEPKALMLDEPFSGLDSARKAEMRAFVFAHVRARNIPAILVTHDPADRDIAQGPMLDLGPPGDDSRP